MNSSSFATRFTLASLSLIPFACRSLTKNTSLLRLDLSKNYVQNRGGVRIGEVLRDENRSLRWFNISFNLMSDKVVPLFRDVIRKNKKLNAFSFEGNQFRPKFLMSLQAVWREKIAAIQRKEEELMGDNSYLKTYESVKRRIRERSRNKKGGSPKSLKKTEREGIKSVLGEGGFFGGGKRTNPKEGIRVADWLSPGGGGWVPDRATTLEPLPFYKGAAPPQENEINEFLAGTVGGLRGDNKPGRLTKLRRQREHGEGGGVGSVWGQTV